MIIYVDGDIHTAVIARHLLRKAVRRAIRGWDKGALD